jgi:hypothetical protein
MGVAVASRAWRVTRRIRLADAHYDSAARQEWIDLRPGDLVRDDATTWFPQGCDNEPNVEDRLAVLSSQAVGLCAHWALWEPDRSSFEPV